MRELTTDRVCWDLAPAPWPSSDSLLSLAVELLPEIEDEPTAVLVEGLAILVTELEEQVVAMRSVLSAELDGRYRLRGETVRLRARLIELREERQRERAPMATTGPRPSPTAREGN